MSRDLRAFGIVVLATAALATVAAVAHATPAGFSREAGAKKLKGSADGAQSYTTTAGEVTCNTFSGEGEIEGTESAEVELTLTFTDEGKEDQCRGPLGTSPTVKTNGCRYRYRSGETLGAKAAGESVGTMDIVKCTTNGSMTVEAVGCIIHVPEQNGLGPVIYKTIHGPPEHITAEMKISNIKYTHTGALCGSGAAGSGTYTGSQTIRAFDSSGVQRNWTVT